MSAERDKIQDAELVDSQHQHPHEPGGSPKHRKQEADKKAADALVARQFGEHNPFPDNLYAPPHWRGL
jgi:hypothetical protein